MPSKEKAYILKDANYAASQSLDHRLAIIRAKAEYMQKDGKGYNYTYATPENVLGFMKPLLAEYLIGFASEVVEADVAVSNLGKSGDEHLIRIKMRFTFYNLDNMTDSRVIEWASFGQNRNEKGFGCALTYGTRYFFLNFFLVPTGEDDPDKWKPPATTRESKSKTKLDIKTTSKWIAGEGVTIAEVEEAMGKEMSQWTNADKNEVFVMVKRLKEENEKK
jgi:hypothetical protein